MNKNKVKKQYLKIKAIKLYTEVGLNRAKIMDELGISKKFCSEFLLGQIKRPCKVCGQQIPKIPTEEHERKCLGDLFCQYCGKQLDSKSSQIKFCSNRCAAKAFNEPRKIKKFCPVCDEVVKNGAKTYCSYKCGIEHSFNERVFNWIEKTIIYRNSSDWMKRYILKEQDNKCFICSLSNEWNGSNLVFILDHIDGNSENNFRDNLRCVCPNCDSQLPTYKSKNKGNGRFSRRKRYKERKSY